MKKIYWLALIFYFIGLSFTRFYNLSNTAQFAEDESGFLVRAHQIYREKKITLVGQINQFGTKVFSSLTIYLLLPAAILGNFDPVSIFYGAAFWGVFTVMVMLYLTKLITDLEKTPGFQPGDESSSDMSSSFRGDRGFKSTEDVINNKMIFLSALLLLFFFPLVRMGRWAWNPNFIPLWLSLGLVFYLKKEKLFSFLAGVCFGLSIHQHYYAIFACSAFIFLVSFKALVTKDFRKIFLVGLGFIFALAPFIIFDLRHPPGIFILGASNEAQLMSTSSLYRNFIDFSFETAKFYTQSYILAVILTIVLIFLIAFDIVKKNQALFYFIPILFQIIFISVLGAYFPHYFFAIIPFFFVWLIYPRRGKGEILSKLAIYCLIIGGALSLPRQLTISPVEPNLATVREIDTILEEQIQKESLKNVNIAVLASPDPKADALKYRNLLLIPNNLSVMSQDDYSRSDYLFVVSTQEEEKVRTDPSHDIQNFRNGRLLDKWNIDEGDWVVYLFEKGV